MQQALPELFESFRQASMDLLTSVNETNRSAFDALLKDQWSLESFGKLAKSYLAAAKSLNDMGEQSINQILQNDDRALGLDAAASNAEEFAEIWTSLAGSLTQIHASAFSAFVSAYAEALRSLKQAASSEEVLAVQTRFQAELQEKSKSAATEFLQTMAALNTGLTAWVERSVEKLAEGHSTANASESGE